MTASWHNPHSPKGVAARGMSCQIESWPGTVWQRAAHGVLGQPMGVQQDKDESNQFGKLGCVAPS